MCGGGGGGGGGTRAAGGDKGGLKKRILFYLFIYADIISFDLQNYVCLYVARSHENRIK